MEPLDVSWHPYALCLGVDPALFFPQREAGQDNSGLEAKRVCIDCPVRINCLDYAVRNNERFGIWGGVGSDRRRLLRRALSEGSEAYLDAINEETEHLGRSVGGFEDERPEQPAKICDRCGGKIPAGRWPKDRNGPNATCGNPSTFNKGCRCQLCHDAKVKADEIKRRGKKNVSPRGEGSADTVDSDDRTSRARSERKRTA